jgi:hypothetical protein
MELIRTGSPPTPSGSSGQVYVYFHMYMSRGAVTREIERRTSTERLAQSLSLTYWSSVDRTYTQRTLGVLAASATLQITVYTVSVRLSNHSSHPDALLHTGSAAVSLSASVTRNAQRTLAACHSSFLACSRASATLSSHSLQRSMRSRTCAFAKRPRYGLSLCVRFCVQRKQEESRRRPRSWSAIARRCLLTRSKFAWRLGPNPKGRLSCGGKSFAMAAVRSRAPSKPRGLPRPVHVLDGGGKLAVKLAGFVARWKAAVAWHTSLSSSSA